MWVLAPSLKCVLHWNARCALTHDQSSKGSRGCRLGHTPVGWPKASLLMSPATCVGSMNAFRFQSIGPHPGTGMGNPLQLAYATERSRSPVVAPHTQLEILFGSHHPLLYSG